MSAPDDTPDAVMCEVETVLAAADPRFWIALEDVRDWLFRDGSGTSTGAPARSDSLPCLAVKALSADGRTREPAVALLAEARSLVTLPVLGLRAADWVPPVRNLARGAILRRLADDPGGAALAALAPMAFLLSGRQQGGWLVGEVTRRLAQAPAGPVVSRLLASKDAGLRRAAYQVLIDSGELGLQRAASAALQDPDIVVRTRCAGYAARLAAETGELPTARLMLASRTPLVRAEALQALNRLGDLDAIRSVLADSNGLVRGTVRFYLRPHGVDFPEAYRQLIVAGGAVTPGAVAGLAEVGTAADAQIFRGLLGHPRSRVRVEALRGLAALAPVIDGGEMLAVVEGDSSAAVIRQAAAVTAARGVAVDPDRLLAMVVDPTRPVQVRLAVRQVLASRDSAWRLAVDMMLLADPETAIADRAKADLSAALRHQVYVRPGGRTAELVDAHLPDADRLLPAAESRIPRFIVGRRLPA
jgi:hypothetical protein